MNIPDPGDSNDPIKWDFNEDNIPVHMISGYEYKAWSLKSAHRLNEYRNLINILCHNLIDNQDAWNGYSDNVNIFLDIHSEIIRSPDEVPEPFLQRAMYGIPVSKYLLSEIPKGINFNGMNKPKMRHINYNEPNIGKDLQGRALYRDIFLDLDTKDLDKLVIHELAHTMANHIHFRPNDHGADFKYAEKLIKEYWPRI